MRVSLFASIAFAATLFFHQTSSAQQTKTIPLWPQTPPGVIAAKGEESDTSGTTGRNVADKPVIRLGNVSKPMLTIYEPAADKRNGGAVIVCPGGGYNILAYDLEGTEVCEWLNSLGYTAALLKYRVPKVANAAKPIEPLQDAQRAIRLLREQAQKWQIDSQRIGVLGFSAGGNLAARLSTNYEKNTYEKVDGADDLSSRPDFTLLIYPAYLFEKGTEAGLAADVPVTDKTPPAFLTMAIDDPVDAENVLRYATALKRVKVPAEVHLYPSGGHGYGLRRTSVTATHWPDRAAEWLQGK